MAIFTDESIGFDENQNTCVNNKKSSLILSIDGHLFEVQILNPDKQGQWSIKGFDTKRKLICCTDKGNHVTAASHFVAVYVHNLIV